MLVLLPVYMQKEPYIHSKEPYIHLKEPYIHPKEPFIHSKKPYIYSKEPLRNSKVRILCRMREVRCVSTCIHAKRASNPLKRALHALRRHARKVPMFLPVYMLK